MEKIQLQFPFKYCDGDIQFISRKELAPFKEKDIRNCSLLNARVTNTQVFHLQTQLKIPRIIFSKMEESINSKLLLKMKYTIHNDFHNVLTSKVNRNTMIIVFSVF